MNGANLQPREGAGKKAARAWFNFSCSGVATMSSKFISVKYLPYNRPNPKSSVHQVTAEYPGARELILL